MVFVLGIVVGVCVATPIVYVLTARYLSAPWPDGLSLTGEHPYEHGTSGPLEPVRASFADSGHVVFLDAPHMAAGDSLIIDHDEQTANVRRRRYPGPIVGRSICDCKGVAGDVGTCDGACQRPGGPREPVDPTDPQRVGIDPWPRTDVERASAEDKVFPTATDGTAKFMDVQRGNPRMMGN